MEETRKRKLKTMWIVLILVTILLGLAFNEMVFHKDGTPAEKGHYESKVYITNDGYCYHSGSCGYLYSSRIAIGRQQAIEQGYRACSVCHGYSSVSIYIEGTKGTNAENHYLESIACVFFGVTLWLGIFLHGWINNFEQNQNNKN